MPGQAASESVNYLRVGTNGQVLEKLVTDFAGRTTEFVHDSMGRLVEKRLPAIEENGQVTVPATTVTYDYTSGQLDRVTMIGGVSRVTYFNYDGMRRLKRKDTPEGVLAYTYTADGLVESIKGYRRAAVLPPNSEIPAGAVPDVSLSYAYDVQGRLETVTDNLLASPNVTRYQYDDVGNLDYSL